MREIDIQTGINKIMGPITLVGAKYNNKHNVMTASWVTQVSFEPPLIAVSVGPDKYTHDLIANAKEFVVSILDESQREIADYCGGRGGDQADQICAEKVNTAPASKIETPLLTGCIANLECQLEQSMSAGDHTLFVGRVIKAHGESEDKPMAYYDGKIFASNLKSI
ncbi:flavin reductase (DIM6/NTAB) family NADH-FMN oxidoreductase RutF [Desulfitispora alkaliphila]|uniref:flavin reductase family protein n=1 Tax=Desulfitispora alkaliphila TaxID=622674 RepID=UPI003D23FF90